MFIQKGGDMTTITTSLPLLPLQSNLSLFEKRLSNDICTMNGIERVLPHSLIRLPSPKREQAQMSPQDCYGSENSQSNSICDMDPRSVHGIDSKFSISTLTDDRTSSEVARSNSASSYKIDNNNKDDEDEYMNYCSDDSELSVGKEVDDSNDMRRNNNEPKSTFRLDDTSLSIHRNNHQSKLPSIVRPNPTRQEEFMRKSHMCAEEIMKHQINFMTVTKGLNISPRLSDNAFSPYLRPNELSPIHNAAINNPLKIGFSRLQAYANDSDLGKKWSVIEDRNARSPETTHFRQIHSHLNAISKITSALGRDNNTRAQMTSPGYTTSRENSQSPPSSNVPSARHMIHNQFNDSSLKFSIDNILKPSFGRRITDPLLKRNKPIREGGTTLRSTHSNNERSGRISSSIDSMANSSLTATDKKNSSLSSDQMGSKNSTQIPANVSNAADSAEKTNATSSSSTASDSTKGPISWPAWVYCTRYSDRPSSGRSPRARRPKKTTNDKSASDEKRPRTAFSGPQLARLKNEFAENRYLTERRRQQLSSELGLNEAQIKIWFQNKRAKIKKTSGQKNPLALQLMAQGLYNHSTVPLTREEEELQEMQERASAEAAKTSNLNCNDHDDDEDDD